TPNRPHGNPPSGQLERNPSTTVHATANVTGRSGSGLRATSTSPRRANHRDCAATSATHAATPNELANQKVSTPLNPIPKHIPVPAAAIQPRRGVVTSHRAT